MNQRRMGIRLRCIRLYKHGFAVRANPENKVEIVAAEQATKQAVEWFNTYLH